MGGDVPLGQNLPGAHEAQSVWLAAPAAVPCVPGGQCVGAVLPVGQYEPAAQASQAEYADADAKVPAAQSRQTLEPTEDAKVPALHSLQVLAKSSK